MTTPRLAEINPNIWYRIGDAASLLGMHRRTLLNRAELGVKNGGIAYRIDKSSGRKEFKGRELIRYITE